MRKLVESGAVVLIDSYPHCCKLVDPVENAAALWAVVDVLERGAGAVSASPQRRGPKPIDYPKEWEELYPRWEAGDITAKEFMERTGLKRGTFYHLVSEYRSIQEPIAMTCDGIA